MISHVVVGPEESSALIKVFMHSSLPHPRKTGERTKGEARAHSNNVNGWPGPAYESRMLVLFSFPPPKKCSSPRTALGCCRLLFDGVPRPFPLASRRSSSDASSSLRHFFGFGALEWEGRFAVPKMPRHSMRVVSGISNVVESGVFCRGCEFSGRE